MKKKIHLLSLCLCMLFGVQSAWAEAVLTGSSGSLTYTLEQNNQDSTNPTYTLTFTGNGEMENYRATNVVPWNDYKEKITQINVDDGVTSIGDRAFNATSITSLSLPSSVTKLGNNCLHTCKKT